MSQQRTAKAGHGAGSGGETDSEDLAAGAARESVAGNGFSVEESASIFGEGLSEAEAQLYAHLQLLTNSKPQSGFPPLDELNARLNEEPYRDSLLNAPLHEEHYQDSLLFPRADEADLLFSPSGDDDWSEPDDLMQGEVSSGLSYFDHRFTELKQLLARKDEGKREIEHIKASLGEILARVEQLAAEMPTGKTLESVDTKLGTISGSLDAVLEQSAMDANRISRAAEEILAASARIREVPVKFETAARRTVEGLGQTVAATASRAAVMAAHQVSERQGPAGDASATERLEAELRALNLQSRETGERTEAALDRVHHTLKDFLGQGPAVRAGASMQPPKKRTGLHVPISGNSAVYKRGDTGFGAAPASEARLDTLLLRDPPPSDPALFEALQEADRKYGRKKPQQPKPEQSASPVGARPAFAGASALLEDEKSAPLGGIAAVAFILLLVSAALFYLHSMGRMDVRMSAVPAAVQQLVRAPARQAPATVASALRIPQKGPALLAATDGNRGSQGATPAEDLEALLAAARNNDRDAQYRIGVRFLNDGGLEGGPVSAARWFEKAADRGHSEAQFMLASMYERGAGVEKNEAKATALYRQAASAGHVRAMHNLGAMLLKNATALSYREAAAWFEQAAAKGFPDSQYNLALLYEHGLGIEQDLLRACQWYTEAAKAGVKEAAAQAERLRRTLPSAQNVPNGGRTVQPGSWRPVLVDTKKSASLGGAGHIGGQKSFDRRLQHVFL
jgi:localization factor PodJL